jgi:hypothetical protein
MFLGKPFKNNLTCYGLLFTTTLILNGCSGKGTPTLTDSLTSKFETLDRELGERKDSPVNSIPCQTERQKDKLYHALVINKFDSLDLANRKVRQQTIETIATLDPQELDRMRETLLEDKTKRIRTFEGTSSNSNRCVSSWEDARINIYCRHLETSDLPSGVRGHKIVEFCEAYFEHPFLKQCEEDNKGVSAFFRNPFSNLTN